MRVYSSAVTFCSFHAMASSVIYYSTQHGKMKSFLYIRSAKNASEKFEKKIMFCCFDVIPEPFILSLLTERKKVILKLPFNHEHGPVLQAETTFR